MNFDKVPELSDAYGSSRTRKRRLTVGVVVVLLLAGGAVAYRRWVDPAGRAAPTAGEQERREQIAALENRIQTLSAQLFKLGDQPPPAEARKLIEEAIGHQTELIRLRPGAPVDTATLNTWQVKLDDVNARDWVEQSAALEAEAEALLRAKQVPAAVAKTKEALRLQRAVNGGLTTQGLKNYAREARLEQETERLEAEPLQAEVARLLAAARADAAAGKWSEALALYGQARGIQVKLNQDYARTRFIDLLAVERIDAEMATLGAGEAHGQMEDFLKQAAAAAAARKLDEADQAFAAAAARQKLINEQFAKSRFVSMENLERIEADRQTLRAQAALDSVRELDRQAAAHLRKRELFQAQQLIGAAREKLEDTIAALPKARGVDEELRQRLAYLNLRQADLVQIQDQTYDLLLPLAGHEQWALFKTEVPQKLFARVMNANPSRNPGRALPVDSVTYAEAGEFCRRLGWALGAPVRLPTAAEFHAAVGEPAATAANAWSRDNTLDKSQPAGGRPANPAGFHDLLGNVAEWLAAGAGDTAQLAGGSFTDSRAQLERAPMRDALKTERARTNGFRVVVEVDLAGGK